MNNKIPIIVTGLVYESFSPETREHVCNGCRPEIKDTVYALCSALVPSKDDESIFRFSRWYSDLQAQLKNLDPASPEYHALKQIEFDSILAKEAVRQDIKDNPQRYEEETEDWGKAYFEYHGNSNPTEKEDEL